MHYDYYPRIKIDYKMEIFFNTVHITLDKSKLTIQDSVFTGYNAKISMFRFLMKIYLMKAKVTVLRARAKKIFQKSYKNNV